MGVLSEAVSRERIRLSGAPSRVQEYWAAQHLAGARDWRAA